MSCSSRFLIRILRPDSWCFSDRCRFIPSGVFRPPSRSSALQLLACDDADRKKESKQTKKKNSAGASGNGDISRRYAKTLSQSDELISTEHPDHSGGNFREEEMKQRIKRRHFWEKALTEKLKVSDLHRKRIWKKH